MWVRFQWVRTIPQWWLKVGNSTVLDRDCTDNWEIATFQTLSSLNWSSSSKPTELRLFSNIFRWKMLCAADTKLWLWPLMDSCTPGDTEATNGPCVFYFKVRNWSVRMRKTRQTEHSLKSGNQRKSYTNIHWKPMGYSSHWYYTVK